MYKTANTLPEKIRSKSVAALLVGLVALTALSMTPPTASAANPPGSYQQSEHESCVRQVQQIGHVERALADVQVNSSIPLFERK